MAYYRGIVLFIAFAVVAVASPAEAEDCLQHFSCQLYGECRLPCLDASTTATPTQAPVPATKDAPSTAPEAKAESPTPKPVRIAHKPKTRLPGMVRVVTNKEIRTLHDLNGKLVSFGLANDRFQAVGRRTFVAAGIKVQETALDFDNALDGVSTGDIAAVVAISDGDAKKIGRLHATNLHVMLMPIARPVRVDEGRERAKGALASAQ